MEMSLPKKYKDISRYPGVNMSWEKDDKHDILVMETIMRTKGKDGKWYLCYCKSLRFIANDMDQGRDNSMITHVHHFHKKRYFDIHYGAASPSITTLDGDPIYFLDEDQRDESERLKDYYT